MRTASAHPPESALFIRPDAIGDLVLFSPVLRLFRAAWPKTRIGVVVRPAIAEIGGMLAPGIEWIPTSLDPYVTGPVEAGEELVRLNAEVARVSPDLIVAACSRRNWLDAALASAVPKARRVAFASAAPDPYYEVPLRFELKAETGETFTEILPASRGPEEWKRNFGLAAALLGRAAKPAPPRIEPGPETLARADEILGRLNLEAGRFVSCAAAGYSNVFLKTWPEERFAETIGWLWKERGLRSLLLGQA
ncbi:MAG: glycosyltransferase family 9 protein, partial [Opitutaceae bacterium]